MKKIFSIIIVAIFAMVANATTISVDFSQFGEGVSCTGSDPVEQNGFYFYGNNSKVLLTKAGFYTGGSSSSSARYIYFTPANDGTLTVTASPSGSSERYVGITTTPMTPKTGADGVVAITLMDTKDVHVTCSADLTAGTTYYICLNGNGTVISISYETTVAGVDKSVLKTLIADASEQGVSADVIAKAMDVYDTPDATQAQVDEAIANLKEAMGITTGINNAAVNNAKAGKFVENGKVVIMKNGYKFNAAGALLK